MKVLKVYKAGKERMERSSGVLQGGILDFDRCRHCAGTGWEQADIPRNSVTRVPYALWNYKYVSVLGRGN